MKPGAMPITRMLYCDRSRAQTSVSAASAGLGRGIGAHPFLPAEAGDRAGVDDHPALAVGAGGLVGGHAVADFGRDRGRAEQVDLDHLAERGHVARPFGGGDRADAADARHC